MAPQVINCPPSSFLERQVGFVAASVFSIVYYFAPLYVLTAPIVIAWAPKAPTTWLWLAPLLLSAALPSKQNKWALQSWPMRCIPKYFDYTEVLEFTDAQVVHYTATKPCMLVVCPHGVISYAGMCSGMANDALPLRPHVLDRFPTAVASVVMKFPLLKHVIGIFGLMDASKKSLVKRIAKGGSFVLYPGGIAELFLASPTEEVIMCRKGFIKLALEAGADVIPVYLFGNTAVLHVFKHPLLVKLSRALGASLTLFWGRWGLPLPLPDRLVYVRGPPLGLPQIKNPTDEQINEWHKKYTDELQRLFSAYKHIRPDYKSKELRITEK